MPGPVFCQGDAVTLRTVEPDDAPYLADLVNEPAVRSGIDRLRPISVADEREWIAAIDEREPHGAILVICVDEEPVGTVSLQDVRPDRGTGELGYVIDPDAWDRGYATDAARTLVDYGFDELGLARVTARAYETNPASARVLAKVGFTEEGRLREGAFVDGERVDVRIFGLLADER